jgi:hypothetical protein
VQADVFAQFYDFALRRSEIELKEGILRNLLFLLLAGREGIEPPDTRIFSPLPGVTGAELVTNEAQHPFRTVAPSNQTRQAHF